MSFLYVDRIFSLEKGKRAHGLKNVTRNEPFFYWLPSGQRVLSPAVITEALAQLGSWLKIYSSDFKKRPVLLADEHTAYGGVVVAGDQIDLFVEILDFDDDVVVSRSYAEVDGKRILQTDCCRGYMLALEEFDDEQNTRRQFDQLFRPDQNFSRSIKLVSEPLPAIAGFQTWDALRFIDGIINHDPLKYIKGFKNFASCEPYFATHFPRKPIVPGVLLMTFIGELCQYLIRENLKAPIRSKALIPTFIRNARFRKFVEPGDQCVLTARVLEGSCNVDGDEIVIQASMEANGNRVMQAEMGFVTMIGSQSSALDVYLGKFSKAPTLSQKSEVEIGV